LRVLKHVLHSASIRKEYDGLMCTGLLFIRIRYPDRILSHDSELSGSKKRGELLDANWQ
jgi:hypothetical protein